jgi:hypothetical protein
MVFRFLVMIWLTLINCLALAQQDTSSLSQKRSIEQLREYVTTKTNHLTTNPLDSLTIIRKIDSLKNVTGQRKSQAQKAIDSLQYLLNSPQRLVNSGVAKVQSKIDTVVHRLNQPADKVNEKISNAQDNLTGKIEDLEEDGVKKVENVQGKADNVQQKISSEVSKATDGNVKVPNDLLEKPKDLTIQNDAKSSQKIPTLQADNLNAPQLNLPGAEKLKVPEANIDLRSLEKKADVNLPGTEKIGGISAEVAKVDKKIEGVGEYAKELDNISKNGIEDAEKLPKEIENQVGKIDEVHVLNKEAKKITEYQNVVQRYRDKKLLQEEILRKSKMVANDKLNSMTPQLKEVQQQIGKAKRLNPAVESFKEITKKRPNEMKGKPFRDRFLPGITFQAYQQDRFTLDCALQTSYRVSGRLTSGLGYSYRISIDDDNSQWIAHEGITAYRFYLQFVTIKNIYVHGEFESARVSPARFPTLADNPNPNVYGSYFGLGKRYNISRRFKGSAAALYRVNYQGEIPNLSKVNLRIGFDLSLKKKSQKLKF